MLVEDVWRERENGGFLGHSIQLASLELGDKGLCKFLCSHLQI